MKIVDWSNTCNADKLNGLYFLKNNVWIDFEYNGTLFRFQVDKGACTDGLSVPWCFRWYLPCWSNTNVLYNLAGIIHDGCYGSELLSKQAADKLFYLGLRKADISPSKAKTALWAVEHLAGLHYRP